MIQEPKFARLCVFQDILSNFIGYLVFREAVTSKTITYRRILRQLNS
jgi:hypothetical protein